MPKRKRSLSEEDCGRARCMYGGRSIKTSRPSQSNTVSEVAAGLSQREENVMMPKKSVYLNTKIANRTTIYPIESSVPEILGVPVVRRSPRGKTPPPKHVDFRCTSKVAQLPNHQSTSKQLGQNSDLDLRTERRDSARECAMKHLISPRSSSNVVTRQFERKEREKKREEAKKTSINVDKRKIDLKFSTKCDRATSSTGEVRRSARIRNRVRNFPMRTKKKCSTKYVKSKHSKSRNVLLPRKSKKSTGTCNKSIRESAECKICEKKTCKSKLTKRLSNSVKSIKQVINDPMKSEERKISTRKLFNFHDSDSKWYKDKLRSNTVLKEMNDHHFSLNPKIPAKRRGSSAVQYICDKPGVFPKIVPTDVSNNLDSGSQSLKVQNSKSDHAQRDFCAPRTCEQKMSQLIHHSTKKPCKALSSFHTKAPLKEENFVVDNYFIKDCVVKLELSKGNTENLVNSDYLSIKSRASGCPDVHLLSSGSSVMSHDGDDLFNFHGHTRSIDYCLHCFRPTESCFSVVKGELKTAKAKSCTFMHMHTGVQNLLEMLQLCCSLVGRRRASLFSREPSESSLFGKAHDNKRHFSLADTICRSITALTVKHLKALTTCTLKLALPERNILGMFAYILSGVRHRLLNEYRCCQTSYGFLIIAKDILFKPLPLVGSSDLMLESSLSQYRGETERYYHQVCCCASETKDTGAKRTTTENVCAKVTQNSVYECLQMVKCLVPKRKLLKRRTVRSKRRTSSRSSQPGKESNASKVLVSALKRKTLHKDRCRKTPRWSTPQERQIQVTLDTCLKNKALNKFPKVKTTQQLVSELFDKSSCQIPVSLEKYLFSPLVKKCNTGSHSFVQSVQTCNDNNPLTNELAGNSYSPVHRADHNCLKTVHDEISSPMLNLQRNETGAILNETYIANCSTEDVQGQHAVELSGTSSSNTNMASSVEVQKHLPRKDQKGEWHVECVGGNFDCYGKWKQLHECCEKESYNGEKLLILPWINIGW